MLKHRRSSHRCQPPTSARRRRHGHCLPPLLRCLLPPCPRVGRRLLVLLVGRPAPCSAPRALPLGAGGSRGGGVLPTMRLIAGALWAVLPAPQVQDLPHLVQQGRKGG